MELNKHRHWFLYAKGHYKKNENILEDLKKIHSNHFCIDADYISKQNIAEFLIKLVEPIIDEKIEGNTLTKFLTDLLPSEIWKCGYPRIDGCEGDESILKYDFYLAIIYNCLSVLGTTDITYCGNLGKPDYKILDKK